MNDPHPSMYVIQKYKILSYSDFLALLGRDPRALWFGNFIVFSN